MRRVPGYASSLRLTNVYDNMWRTLEILTLDPFPSVNQQAGVIVNFLTKKVQINTIKYNVIYM